jgi:hypothetical protein
MSKRDQLAHAVSITADTNHPLYKAVDIADHHADYHRLLNKYVELRKRERRLLDAIEEAHRLYRCYAENDDIETVRQLGEVLERAQEGLDEQGT